MSQVEYDYDLLNRAISNLNDTVQLRQIASERYDKVMDRLIAYKMRQSIRLEKEVDALIESSTKFRGQMKIVR